MTVKTRAQINSEIATLLADNTSEEISPADLRTPLQDLADSSKMAEDLATVATTGAYADLSGKPTLGSAAALNAGTAAGNVPVLDGSGKIAAGVLPSYVDDVLEFTNFAALPATGETGKIYVTLDTNFEYRWGGSAYTQLVASPGSTDAVPEGSTNQYFTAARVRAVVLTGLTLLSSAAVVATDTVLDAIGKLQKQISDLTTSVQAIPVIPSGRLTLTSGVAITTTDVVGATSIYYTPGNSKSVPIYSGSTWVSTVFTELTLALDATSGHTGYHQASKNFDLFVINDSGTIRLVTGPAWSSDTARGTGAGTTELELKDGIWTNKQALSAARFGSASGNTVAVSANRGTFVGSIRTTADGVVEDSAVKRLVSNAYNLANRRLRRIEPVSSWTYSTATMRQANGNTANKVEVLNCLSAIFTNVVLQAAVQNSTTTPQQCVSGIGLDSTTTRFTDQQVNSVAYAVSTQQFGSIGACFSGNCGLGYHYLAWLEQGAGAADTQTWYSLPAFGLLGDTLS